MIKTKIYTFPVHINGTTFREKLFKVKSGLSADTLAPMDLTGARIKMEFRKEPKARPVLTFDTSDSTILVPDPESGEMILQERIIDVCEGTYLCDVLAKFPDNTVKLLFQAFLPTIKSLTQI